MVIRRLIELLAPPTCLGCGNHDNMLCQACVETKVTYREPVCIVCDGRSALGRTCERCVELTPLSGVSVGARYDGVVKELILQLKFHRQRVAVEAAAELLLGAVDAASVQCVTAVPVAPDRYRERGYNQSDLLARVVARRLKVPYSPLLGRLNGAHQIGRGRQERLEGIRGAFFARRQLRGEGVLVVDDVVTTGATLAECALVLRRAGAGVVRGAVVARR